MILFLTILVPLIAAGVVAVGPARLARRVALGGTWAAFGLTVGALFRFDWSAAAAFQFGESNADWLPSLGLRLAVGVDSVALLLIALTALLGPICVLASTTAITERVKTYYAWLLVLQAAMTLVFASRDLILFYIGFEFTLIPMWVLINLYGSTNRVKAATKFFLYTFTGSMLALAGLVYVAWFHAVSLGLGWTFDIGALAQAARQMSAGQQAWVFAALLAGFAVKVPLFPFHTWLPLAHTEAPTAGSVILAGVLLKLGTYGIYRFALPFAPQAAWEFAPLIAVICIIGIVYAGLICWVQTDVKKLVAYSSVSHLGFCILGLVAFNAAGVSGSVLYMINHGLSTGALFLLIGMIYERYHTRSMKELGGLAAKMPVWATFMVFFTLASVGLPGLNGFVGEFLCLLGAFQAGGELWWGDAHVGGTPGRLGPWYAAVAGTGMIVAAIYLLYMVGKVVFGPLVEPHAHHDEAHADGAKPGLPADLNAREIGILAMLAVPCIVLGLYPAPALDAIHAPVMETVRTVLNANGVATPRPERGTLGASHEPAASTTGGGP
ncbi:MAG: NuoM family protein [Phycisphaerales bacterium]